MVISAKFHPFCWTIWNPRKHIRRRSSHLRDDIRIIQRMRATCVKLLATISSTRFVLLGVLSRKRIDQTQRPGSLRSRPTFLPPAPPLRENGTSRVQFREIKESRTNSSSSWKRRVVPGQRYRIRIQRAALSFDCTNFLSPLLSGGVVNCAWKGNYEHVL